MPRVLHIIDSLGPGGIETWLLRMVEAMPCDQFAMDFFCKRKSAAAYADQAKQLGASVFCEPLCIDHIRYVRRLTDILKRGQYDIVHNHLDYASAPGVWASRRLGVPVVSTVHNTTFPPLTWTRLFGIRQLREFYGRHSLAYTLKNSTIVSGVSRGVLDCVHPDHADNDRFRVLYLGVEATGRATAVERDKFRRELGLAADTRLILHVGRFADQKNHRGLLRIFQRVREQTPNAILLMVGDGPLRAEIEQAIADGSLSNTVRCLGQRDDVTRIMSCADVFLFPSFHEGFPVVCLEAAAAELPVVGSDIAGLNEAVIDGQTGLLHPVGDEAVMADSVARLLNNTRYAETIRRAALARIRSELTTQAVVERLTQLYNDALRRTPATVSTRQAA